VQGSELDGVARDEAAEKSGVDRAVAASRGTLGLQTSNIGGGRDAVERHIEQRGHTAGRRCAGGGLESLPLGAPGLVHMDVGIHQSREDQGFSCLDQLHASGYIVEIGYSRDPTVRDVNGGCAHSLGRHDSRSPNDQRGLWRAGQLLATSF